MTTTNSKLRHPRTSFVGELPAPSFMYFQFRKVRSMEGPTSKKRRTGAGPSGTYCGIGVARGEERRGEKENRAEQSGVGQIRPDRDYCSSHIGLPVLQVATMGQSKLQFRTRKKCVTWKTSPVVCSGFMKCP